MSINYEKDSQERKLLQFYSLFLSMGINIIRNNTGLKFFIISKSATLRLDIRFVTDRVPMQGQLPNVYKDTIDMKTLGRLEVQTYPLIYANKKDLLIRKTVGFGLYWPETPCR
jgi:hypothetical protein